ncbi:sister chromatid cohesion 1 protein 1 isoform X2 [Vitis vinifera]|uniref:sister chromatid cohesion 1 protein 1 isoform X2 n=1 Tax=Vitis vinifera TaxID=29760 RepID=UPI0005403459|nr:sister chromatid cohesion 1 protein 1 isoform X2 [Vitis vinifera]|eukprot:XP_010658236.1 PREDICTED: sister chromatid cohesion 1 protein 1 isoform X2 [Vitis vinifera]
MFYSHQLLARKAALGQIWMAATMHAKMNRRKLDKLNIIKICEEILNPSVPMALRLSGILMGGVVIIYERKSKSLHLIVVFATLLLLSDDVTRLMVELNEAWKVKAGAGSHSTDLPKRKSQAKYEAVTLPDNEEGDAPEIERFLNFSNTATTVMGLQPQGAYICVCLDNVDETYITGNTGGEDVLQDNHQADADNITLWEPFNSYQADTNLNNRDERFEEDGEIQLNFTPAEQIPSTLIPSPSHQNEHQKGDPADEIQDLHPENQVNQQPDEHKEVNQSEQDQPRQGIIRKRGRRPAAFVMDDEQIIIPGNLYQSWLQDPSNIVARRGKRRKNLMPIVKIANLMELPPSTLIDGILTSGTGEIQYPAPLLELWMRSIQLPHDSPSGRNTPPQPPEPSSSSPSHRVHHQGPAGFPFEDFLSGVGSPSLGVSIEKQRGTNHDNNESQFEILMTSLRTKLMNDNARTTEAVFTPGNSGGATVNEVRSFPGSASGHGSPSHTSEVNSGRINKKRPYSWSRHSGSSLEPVDEEHPFNHTDPNFKLSKLSEHELLVETGPTQTQNPIIPPPIEKITDSIRMHLKTHFDTPGAPQRESLDQLASGMDRPRAAQLFYQTCVLATRGFIKVEQNEPYGDILISRGAKM